VVTGGAGTVASTFDAGSSWTLLGAGTTDALC